MNVYIDRKPPILHAYADFISSIPWDYYSTVTYRQPRSDDIYAVKKAYSVLEKFDAVRAVVAVEPSRFQGIHLHMLSRHFPSLDTSSSMWKYFFKACGRTTIEPVGDLLAVSRYCSKYVVKENNVAFCGDPEAWRYL